MTCVVPLVFDKFQPAFAFPRASIVSTHVEWAFAAVSGVEAEVAVVVCQTVKKPLLCDVLEPVGFEARHDRLICWARGRWGYQDGLRRARLSFAVFRNLFVCDTICREMLRNN